MIVCKQCGHQNEDSDTFCGSCGKFLEWTGERVVVAQPAALPAEPEPEPEPVHQTFFDRVKQAVGLDESASTGAASAAEPAPEEAPVGASVAAAPIPGAWPPATAAGTPPAPMVTSVAPPSVTSASAPAAAPPAPPLTPVPVSSASAPGPPVNDEPISRKPISVMPAPPRPRPVARPQETPTRRQPGDLICGQCGEGNEPTRHFCRRCGNSLDEAAIVRLSWWRRLRNALFPSRTREAGWRPQRVGGVRVLGLFWRLLRLAVVALIVVALILIALVPPFRSGVQSRVTSAVTTIWHRIHPTLTPVSLIADTASSSIRGHEAKLAIDANLLSYWAAAPQDAQPVLRIEFNGDVDLAEFLVTPGPAGTAPTDQFKAQPRPAKLHLVFSDGTVADVTVADQQGTQHFGIDVKHVNGVVIHVVSTYPALAGSPKVSSVAISEIEFQTRD